MVTPVNPSLSRQEMRYQLADTGAKVLVADQLNQCEPPQSDTTRGDERVGGVADLRQRNHGRPKGVMLGHVCLNTMCRSIIHELCLTRDDHSLLILPLFHVNGIVVGIGIHNRFKRENYRNRELA